MSLNKFQTFAAGQFLTEFPTNTTWAELLTNVIKMDGQEHSCDGAIILRPPFVGTSGVDICELMSDCEHAAQADFAQVTIGDEKETAVRPTNYDDFVDRLKPIQNPYREEFNGLLWETFGPDLEIVRETFARRPQCVWTIIDAEGTTVFTNGMHYVNRLGYILCENSFIGPDCEVSLDDEVQEELQPA